MQITKEELAKHKTADDCWVAVHSKVYNVSSYLASHPGGFEMLFDVGGTDCTDDFEAFGHSESAATMLKPMYIGDLVDVVTTTTTALPAERLVATEKSQPTVARAQLSYVEMELTSVEKLSADSANFVFQADDSETSTALLKLLPGYHIDIR
jgi:cytochrome b involved in lipid metabolism